MSKVLAKIKRAYDIAPQDWAMSTTEKNTATQWINAMIDANKNWKKIKEEQMAYSELTQVDEAALDATAKEMMHAHLDGLLLREKLLTVHVDKKHPGSSSQRYMAMHDQANTKNDISNTYINHITNRFHQQFCELGFTRESSHSLIGFLMRDLLDIHESLTGMESESIQPIQLRRHSKEDRVAEMENYWQTRRDALSAKNRTLAIR